ncbi:hypothetical protein Y032_0009g543 [Ancylostoma ceylanicum]|nr:hypothetical protein Y032_0009g543 [Ancylostoma ceylanicum]
MSHPMCEDAESAGLAANHMPRETAGVSSKSQSKLLCFYPSDVASDTLAQVLDTNTSLDEKSDSRRFRRCSPTIPTKAVELGVHLLQQR